MMGMKARVFRPLANVSLENLVPTGHFYCSLERTLDLAFIRDLVRDRYAAGGICNDCPVNSKCTTSETGRDIKRSFDEAYLDRVRSYHTSEAYKTAIRKRKVWVEPLFAEGKAWHGMARFRLRMLEQVNIEGLVIAAGQNLKRLLSWRGWGRRWWPSGAGEVVIPSLFCLHSWVPT